MKISFADLGEILHDGGGRDVEQWLVFSIDLQRGKTYKKEFEELNYKYSSKRLQVDLLRDSGEVCR